MEEGDGQVVLALAPGQRVGERGSGWIGEWEEEEDRREMIWHVDLHC